MDGSDRRRAFGVFAVLWAAACGFEYARSIQGAGALGLVALVLLGRFAAVWVVSNPGRIPAFVALNAAIVATIATKLPKVPNHGWLVGVASTTILVTAAVTLRGGRRPDSDRLGDWYDSFAPLLRWELIALYFWAVVQKLNSDFFDPALSCGPAQVWNLDRVLRFLPESEALDRFGIHGTLGVEAAIPLLLAIGRTRYLGIGLALGFHGTLGASYTGFSAALFALFSLFAPPSFWRALGGVLDRLRRLARVGAIVDRPLGVAVAALAGFAVVSLLFFPRARAPNLGSPWLDGDVVLGLWIAWGAAVIAAFAWGVLRNGLIARGTDGAFRPPHKALFVLPLLLFAVGLAPHLGLKNTQAFAMFSNLQTGAGRSNHLLIPASWQIFDQLDDPVTIRESSDPVLAKLVGPSWKAFNYFSTYVVDRPKLERTRTPPTWQLPYTALRRRVSALARAGRTDVRLVYERRGTTRRLDNAETDPELSSLPMLAEKLLLLRAMPSDGRGYCMW